MEKKIKDGLKGFVSESALNALEENDKQCGSNPEVKVGMRMKISGGDYIPNVRTYATREAALADGIAENRIKVAEDGSFYVDNSYYALIGEGDMRTLSLRALTSWTMLEACPEGVLKIASGRASAVFADCKPYNGRTIEVISREDWEAGETQNGREQRFGGYAIAVKVVEE